MLEFQNNLQGTTKLLHHCCKIAPAQELFFVMEASSGPQLAHLVQHELTAATGFVDKGIRQANFFVLRDPRADLDHSTGVGVFDLFDFLEFQRLFVG